MSNMRTTLGLIVKNLSIHCGKVEILRLKMRNAKKTDILIRFSKCATLG